MTHGVRYNQRNSLRNSVGNTLKGLLEGRTRIGWIIQTGPCSMVPNWLRDGQFLIHRALDEMQNHMNQGDHNVYYE